MEITRSLTPKVYEYFEPTTEWAREVEHDTMLLYLPGFRRIDIKLQITSTKQLQITGERPIGDNKWGRFKTEIALSSNYDYDKISAKFENCVLNVVHPKKIMTNTTTTKPQETSNPTLAAPELQKPPTEPPQAQQQLVEQNLNTQQVSQKDAQETSSDKKGINYVVDQAELVANTSEVSESKLIYDYGRFIISTNLVVVVASLAVLVIGMLYVNNVV